MPGQITTVTVKPVVILSQTITDGVVLFESRLAEPIATWGVIVNSGDGGACGLAPNETTARRAAEAMCLENGWMLVTTESSAFN